MALCKNMQIHNCCLPNALLTLKEYLDDYASEDTRQTGEKLIAAELGNIPNEKARSKTAELLSAISEGKRDFRF